MDGTSKAITAVLLCALALLAGAYLSGFLTLWLLGLHNVPLSWNIYWRYYTALDQPQIAAYATRIKAGGIIGFGLPLFGWIALMWPMLKSKALSTHGDARFARRADLAKAGLLKDDPYAVVLGKFGRELIRLGGQQHAIVTAPTRSGKTAGIAIPNLLYYQGSIVAMDTKGELFAKTSKWRKEVLGQAIYVFAPYAEDQRTHRFNPFMCVSRNPKLRNGQLRSIGAILYPDNPNKDPFWTNSARSAFFGFALYMFEAWDDAARRGVPLDPNTSPNFPSFERIYRRSSSDGRDMKVYLHELMQAPFISDDTRTALANLASQAEQTLSSIIGSMQEPLHMFLGSSLADATNASDFDVADLRKRKMTIYIIIPPNKLAEAGKILNIFISTVMNQNTNESPEENPAIKHPCLLLMDEFCAMGRVESFESMISLSASYWMRSMPIFQSLSQLDAIYGHDVASNIRTNHNASIVFPPREQRDANEYSEAIGYVTLRKRQRTRSSGPGGATSYTEIEERRALMLPQELKALGKKWQIIFYEDVPYAIKCKKIWYFKDRFFKKRLRGKVTIPQLKPNTQSSQAHTTRPPNGSPGLQMGPTRQPGQYVP